MNILFILPQDSLYRYQGGFSKSISYAPLTLSVLAAMVPKEYSATIVINDEGVDQPITSGEFDLVAITCVTSSARRAYELCAYWKRKGSYVILGGAHPTLLPEEALEHGDSVFVGLAEETFPQFLADFKAGKPQRVYQHQACSCTLSMPIPRRDLLSHRYMKVPTVLANRGCQNQCKFCSIPAMWGNQGLTRPIDEVIHEIKSLGGKRMILLDPSITSLENYAQDFFKALIPLNIKWSGLSTLDVVKKPALFEAMVQSGCEGILVGFESVNTQSLIQAGKKTNTIEKYKESVKAFHQADIPVLGCFVAGMDGDTQKSLLETLDIIDEIGIDLPRFSILTPFPGTELFRDYEKQGRILTRNWDLYDTMHVVFKPQHMTPEELYAVFRTLWSKAYTFKRVLSRVRNTRREKLLKLGANLGFKYYGYKLKRMMVQG